MGKKLSGWGLKLEKLMGISRGKVRNRVGILVDKELVDFVIELWPLR